MKGSSVQIALAVIGEERHVAALRERPLLAGCVEKVGLPETLEY